METDVIPEVPNDDPQTYCRLCFSGFYVEPLFPADAEPKQKLIDLISKHIEIHLTVEMDYLCCVCRMCQMTLEGFHKYRERCLKLDEVLQRKRLETMPIRVKEEHEEEIPHSSAIGFEQDTIYCLSDTDDEDAADESLEPEQEESLVQEQHHEMLPDDEIEDADEEELIRGDMLIKPEPYGEDEAHEYVELEEDEHEETEVAEKPRSPAPARLPREAKTKALINEIVVLESDDDEKSMETSTRASSEARDPDYGKEEPTAALPFGVTSDGAYECTICKETFRLMKEIKAHIRKDHPQESQVYPCHYCAKKFSDRGSLRFHTRFHTLDFPFSCDECGAKFTMKMRLDKHKSRYHDKDSPSYTDKRFKCTLCPRIFLQEQARYMHITHFHQMKPTDAAVEPSLPNSQVFYCEPCAEAFETQETWREHMNEHHPTGEEEGPSGGKAAKISRRFKCPDCNKLFRHRTAFRSHILINHGTMPHKCEICGSGFERKTKLAKHVERWHGENSPRKVLERYKCDQCERYFMRNQDRIRHEQIVHSIENPAKLPSVWEGRRSNFPCSKCDRKFPTMKTMRIHFALKHPEVPVRFKCTVCSKLFKHKTTLRDHMANHTGLQPYICNECEERFIRKKDLDKHMRTMHGDDAEGAEQRERFACAHCPRILLSKTARLLHIKHHHADKEPMPKSTALSLPESLTCTHCKKSFTSRNTLKLHILNHLGKLPHACDQCDSGFYKPADLLKHKQRYHTGGSALSLASRFKCAYCPRVFVRKSARRYHHTVFHGIESKKSAGATPRTTGTGKRKRIKQDPGLEYPCSICTLVFVTSTMLQMHHKQHHPDQQFFYKCPHCPKRMGHRNSFLSHVKIHIGGYRYPCDECNAQFDRKVLLVGHKQRYHSDASKNTQRFRCTLCAREFVRNQDRVRHQVTVHNYQVKGSGSKPAAPSASAAAGGKGKRNLLKIKQEHMLDYEAEDTQLSQVEYPPNQEEEEPEPSKATTMKQILAERAKNSFMVSSDVEELDDDDDDDDDDDHDADNDEDALLEEENSVAHQSSIGDGSEISDATVPTISSVMSIKQEASAARREASGYTTEF